MAWRTQLRQAKTILFVSTQHNYQHILSVAYLLKSSASPQTEALVEQVLSNGEHPDGWALLDVFRGWMEANQAFSPVFYTKFGTTWFSWYGGVWPNVGWSWRSFPSLMILWFYEYTLTDNIHWTVPFSLQDCSGARDLYFVSFIHIKRHLQSSFLICKPCN